MPPPEPSSGDPVTRGETESTPPRVVLYGKPGCCLCEEAKGEIELARARRAFVLDEIDISLDPVLHRRYGERIPVVEVAGEAVFELHVEATALCEVLDRVVS